MLTEAQVAALELHRHEKEAHGEFENKHPSYKKHRTRSTSARSKTWDAFTSRPSWTRYSKVAFASSIRTRPAVTAADLLNDRVVPFFDDHGNSSSPGRTPKPRDRVCGIADAHPYELYLAVEDIEHTKDEGAADQQTNGNLPRALPQDRARRKFYRITFHQKLYTSLDRSTGRPRRVDRPVQRGKNAHSGSVVFRKNTAALPSTATSSAKEERSHHRGS